jgi:type II secretory pathway pseudopilin PulG
MKTNQNGRSMIEMLGVLAIIGVLTVGGIIGYTKAMAKYRSNKLVDQVTQFITNVRTMYAAQQTYVNLNNNLAIDLGLAPDELVQRNASGVATGILRDVFSGYVQVSSSTVDGADLSKNGAFILTFSGLSRDACIAVATSDWGSGSSSGLVGIHVWNAGTAWDEAPASDATHDTIKDADIKGLTRDTVTGTATEGNYIAMPGNTPTVPLTIDQAMSACSCVSQATCAVSWKYF